MSLEPFLKSKLLDLGLRACWAGDLFRDIDGRLKALGGKLRVKPKVQEAAAAAVQFLDQAREILARNSGEVSELVAWAHPHVVALESGVSSLRKELLDMETNEAIREFRSRTMSERPFALRPGVTVTDPVKFRTALEEDMKGGARWKMGSLLSDLRDFLAVTGG